MKKYMPLEGLRWSRDSGSTLCDTPQNGRSRTGWGGQFWIPNGKTWLGCFVIYAVVVFLEKTNNISVRQYGVHEPFSILIYLLGLWRHCCWYTYS